MSSALQIGELLETCELLLCYVVELPQGSLQHPLLAQALQSSCG